MERSKAIAIIVAVIAAIVAIVAYLKKKVTPPPTPPPPDRATLWGIVTDASTGKPIGGIEAALDSFGVTTGVDGRYEFLEVEPGTYNLAFTDPLGKYEPLTL